MEGDRPDAPVVQLLFRKACGNLQTEICVFVQNPIEWKGEPVPTDDEKQIVFQRFAAAINQGALNFVARRIRTDRLEEWKAAYNRSGRDSTFERGHHQRRHQRKGGPDSRWDAVSRSE
jgi:hypothetical protein